MGFNSRGLTRQGNYDWFGQPPIILDAPLYESRFQNIKNDGSTNNQLPVELGRFGIAEGGRVYRYVRFADTTAASEGSVLTYDADITLSSPALSSDGMSITFTDANAIFTVSGGAAVLRPDLIGAYVFFRGSSGSVKAGFRRIVDHTTNSALSTSYTGTLYLDRQITTAETPAGTLAVIVRRPHTVKLAAAVDARVVGVSAGTLSVRDTSTNPNTEYCGWMQVKGPGLVNVTNASTTEKAYSGTPTTGAIDAAPTGILVPTATAGSAVNYAPSSTPLIGEYNYQHIFGFARTFGILDGIAAGRVLAQIDSTRNAF